MTAEDLILSIGVQKCKKTKMQVTAISPEFVDKLAPRKIRDWCNINKNLTICSYSIFVGM